MTLPIAVGFGALVAIIALVIILTLVDPDAE